MQDARARFGRSVFDALVSGTHMTADGVNGIDRAAGFVPPSFEGTRNLAKKVSQPRVIHYKDAAIRPRRIAAQWSRSEEHFRLTRLRS